MNIKRDYGLESWWKWWMCISFTSLNVAYPIDGCSLPYLDMLVDSTIRYSNIKFLNVFFKYHQIQMYLVDSKKTTFITYEWLY